MRRVYVSCFGSGLGHATRMLEVARLLSGAGCTVVFSSSGEVSSFIRRMGFRCYSVPLVDVSYTPDGEFSASRTLALSPLLSARACLQFAQELRNISSFSPDVVLSDSMLSTVVAAKLRGMRVVTVLNQLRLQSSHSSSVVSSAVSAFTAEWLGRLWGRSDSLLIPDLPPPYTISERNLWGVRAAARARYIGFLVPENREGSDKVVDSLWEEKRPKIFFQVSGPPRTRGPLLRAALEVASRLSDRYLFVLSGGDPEGSPVPKRIAGGWYYEWCGVTGRLFRECDVVVSRAGHGTLSQIITNSKPSLLIPIPGQTEQEGNASKAVRLGISLRLDQRYLSSASFNDSMERLLSGKYAERAREVGRVANSYSAKQEVLSEVMRLSGQ
jgi:UDP-N-acetylglucosamine--N-acetylmuramyl-(pentapeptide) pyrophosphoryl-undecaprenol N-acetylglucosamine transferase